MHVVKDINNAIDKSLIDRIKKIKHVALDMDGTIYKGDQLFPYTIDFLEQLKKIGVEFSFLTNNPTKSIPDYINKLKKIGISVNDNEIYTTVVATIEYLKREHPEVKKIFFVGTPSMIQQFEHEGFISCKDDINDVPDAVVVAFDTTLVYDKLCRAAWWISQNKLYIATNPDRVCPTDLPTILVDCASICACINTATDKVPTVVLGKPQKEMLDGLIYSRGLKHEEIAMVGDRIYTDIMLAHNAGAFGVLVLSGEATMHDANRTEDVIDLVLPSIKELGDLIQLAKKQ